MSTTLPNSRQYDDFLPLFTNNKQDRRPSLFLSSLKNSANGLRKTANRNGYDQADLALTSWDAKNTEFFKEKYGLGDNDAHIEWIYFLVNTIALRAGQTKASLNASAVVNGPVSTNGDEVLEAIKKVGNAPQGSMAQLVALLLQHKLLSSVTKIVPGTAPEDLTVNPSRWGEATDFLFRTELQMIAADIIGNNVFAMLTQADVTNMITQLRAGQGGVISWQSNLLTLFARQFFLILNISVNGVYPGKYVTWAQYTSDATDTLALRNTVIIEASNSLRYNNPTNVVTAWGNLRADIDRAFTELIANGITGPSLDPTIPANNTPLMKSILNRHQAAINILNSFNQKIRYDIFGAVDFGYNYDKFFVNTFLTRAVKNAKLPVSSIIRDFSDTNQTTQDKYYRKPDGTLMERKKDGTEVSIDEGSAAHQALKESDKCYTTGVANDGNLTCSKYIRECISGGDVTNCKNYLLSSNFWQNASKEVEDMLPLVAYKTLKSFEFGTLPVFNKSVNRTIKKVQNWGEWLESLKSSSKLQPNEITAIAANVKLQEYLNALVFKVNSNPAIINEDYKGNMQTDLSENFKNNLLAKMGLKLNLAPRSLSTSSLINLSNAMVDSRNRMRISLGSMPGVSVTMFGGASRAENHLLNTVQQQHQLISSTFEALKKNLKNHKKEIAAGDEADITKMIQELKDREVKLNNLILITEKYTELLETYGQQDSNSSLTMKHLDEFVTQRNNYFEKVSRKQVNLMSIIRSIAEKVNELSDKSQQKNQTEQATPLP